MSRTTDWVIDTRNKEFEVMYARVTEPVIGQAYFLPLQDTMCMGLVPIAEDNGYPAMFTTEKGAEAAIADLVVELAQRIKDPDDDFNWFDLANQIEDCTVMEVKVCEKHLVWPADYYKDPKCTPVGKWPEAV